MAKRIDKIFDECINRLNSGESIESCLQRYPEEAPELSVLLQTYVNVKWRSSIVQPNPAFKARARLNMLYTQRIAAQRQPYRQPERQRQPSGFNFGRIWAPALAGIIVFVLVGSAGTAAAATGSMPDEPLYTVKLATEQVQLALAFSETDKAIINTEIAEKRSEEIEVMASQGKTDQVIATAARMVKSLENAEAAINKLSETWAYTSGPQPVTPVTPVAPVTATKTTPAPTATVKTTPSTGTSPSATTSTPTLTSTAATDNASQSRNTQAISLSEKTEKLKRTVSTSMNKNVTSLESALNKAPDSAKATIQKAIDIAKSKRDSFNSTRFDSHSSSGRDSDDRNTSNYDSRGSKTTTPSTSNQDDGKSGNSTGTTVTPTTTSPASSTQSGTATTPVKTTPGPTTTPSIKTNGASLTTDNDSANVDINFKSNTGIK
ncbi:MAG: hypothetical protein A2Z02_01565, partial [Chloroflexi bacterium RBG_16_48_7]